MQIFLNSTEKFHNMHNCRKFMQIRCQKGAGTKVLKCLVGTTHSKNIKLGLVNVHCTVGKIIISAPKMQNNFWYNIFIGNSKKWKSDNNCYCDSWKSNNIIMIKIKKRSKNLMLKMNSRIRALILLWVIDKSPRLKNWIIWK